MTHARAGPDPPSHDLTPALDPGPGAHALGFFHARRQTMPTTIRTGCIICGRAFVKGDYPHIVARTGPDGEQIAAHQSCWDATEQAAAELGTL